MTSDQAATFMDHHYLNFWLWACLRDAEAYLAASAALRSTVADGIRPECSLALAWPGLTAPPVPAHPFGRSVEHPG